MTATRRKSTAAKAAVKKTTAPAKRAAPRRPAEDVDYSKSTGAFPMGAADKQPTLGGVVDDDVDYAASTMAYPMGEATQMRFLESHLDEDGNPVDFSKSVGRYPMYGESDPRERHFDVETVVEVRSQTPGPQSSGVADGPKGWQAQRDRLGLDPGDPTGESDTNWKPEDAQMTHDNEDPGVPHTTPDGQPVTHEEKHPNTETPATQAKVITPPAKDTPAKQTQADTK